MKLLLDYKVDPLVAFLLHVNYNAEEQVYSKTEVQRSNSYDKIISQFVGGMTVKRTLKGLEKHCKNFITALSYVGGPVKSAALMIHVQQDWIDTVKQELQIELQLN